MELGGGEGGAVVSAEGGGGEGSACETGEHSGLGVRDFTGDKGHAA